MDAFRRIPSTHIAAALGIADWSTPLATYQSVREDRAWDENPEEPQRGVRLKPALRAWAGSILDRQFLSLRQDLAVGERSKIVSVRPDGVTASSDVALLVKTPVDSDRWYTSVGDAEEGVDERVLAMPFDVRVECAVVHAVMRPKEVHVAVLLGGQLKTIEYRPEQAFESQLASLLAAWWVSAVEKGCPPSARKGDEAALRKLFPKATKEMPGEFESLDNATREAVLLWARAQRQRTAAQKVEKETKPTVIQALGDYPGMVGFPVGSGIKSISFDERAPHANNATWNAIAHELMAKCSTRVQKRLLEKHTPEVGTRVLRPFFDKAVQ